jgi:acyl carrier protein
MTMIADALLVDRVRGVMAETFGVDEDELPEDVSQEDFERWTSLYHITLVLALEDAFGTSFSSEEMEAMTSQAAIVATLKRGQPLP